MPTTGTARLTDLVGDLKRDWRAGAPPDVFGVLREHPELLGHRSLVVDLAYEEYCLREEAGRAPDADAFCRDLPAFRSQVREVLRGHREIADHPELFESPGVDWPGPGDQFAGLTVVQELGRGAFARAYLARDPDTGDKPVVLKLSQAASGEARTLGPVRHPHVVGVHWARRADGLFAICLPFVGAATLRDAIDAAFGPAADRRSAGTILTAIDRAAAPLPEAPDPAPPLLDGRRPYPEAVAALFARLAGALAHLHRLGVAHGDLKPSNVLLGPGGHPYLIDFNLAGGPGDSVLRCGGTLPYMAPERLRVHLGVGKDPGAADRADVYSFGVVLFESLTGRLPYEPPLGSDGRLIAADLLRQSAAGPRRPAGVPGPLARLIETCLAEDPGRRPTAAELERTLARHLRPWPWRRWILPAATGLIVAGFLASQPGRSPAPPATPDEFVARGMGFLRANDVTLALRDFEVARQARADGRTIALVAYCKARMADHEAAAQLYEDARRAGYDAAWSRNNRANSLIHLGSPAQLGLAAAELAEALRLDSGLHPALLNRAWVRFLQARRLPGPGPTSEDPGLLADIRAVLHAGPETSALYYKAALIVLTFGGGTEEARAEAVRYLGEAVRLGRDPGSLTADRLLAAQLKGRSDFDGVIRMSPGQAPPPVDIHLAPPDF